MHKKVHKASGSSGAMCAKHFGRSRHCGMTIMFVGVELVKLSH
jgi:hypothetical protein